MDYWQRRWADNDIAFHEGKPNDLLVERMQLLQGRRRVLVPLAGKSKDMVALERAGHDVVGVEAVETACRQFRDENPHSGVALYCANFFDASVDEIGVFDAAWDRAALVAIEPAERARYVDVLRSLLRKGGRVLLVSLVYDQAKIDGPPWSLDAAALRRLFLPRGFVMEPLIAREREPREKFRAAGIDEVSEELWLLARL
jgi:thiopurine S-methyltransferase